LSVIYEINFFNPVNPWLDNNLSNTNESGTVPEPKIFRELNKALGGV